GGRRWIAIDSGRVALALARTRLMAARYRWYLLTDSPEGRRKEAELTRQAPARRLDTQRSAPGLRLRARPAHHVEVDCKQFAHRRHLGKMASDAGTLARVVKCCAGQDVGGRGAPA